MNQLQPVEETAYKTQATQQVATQAALPITAGANR